MRRVILLLIVSTWFGPSLSHGASFRGLGDLQGGAFYSGANGVSADGSTIVGVGQADGGLVPVRWTASGIEALATPSWSAGDASAAAATPDGAVVVGSIAGDVGQEAFRWTAEGGARRLGDLPGGLTYGYATDVSADGEIVVGVGVTEVGGEAFRWSEATGLVGIGFLDGYYQFSNAWGVSADGSVIVGETSLGYLGYQAFRWTETSGMEALGTLDGGLGDHSRAFDVSEDGTIIVGTSDFFGRGQAFRWTETGGMEALPDPDLPLVRNTEARAMSGDGRVIAGFAITDSVEAVLWANGQGTLLSELLEELGFGDSIAGWNLQSVTGISSDGRTIVGSGLNPRGAVEGWVAIIPEPSTLLLTAIGLVALGVRRPG